MYCITDEQWTVFLQQNSMLFSNGSVFFGRNELHFKAILRASEISTRFSRWCDLELSLSITLLNKKYFLSIIYRPPSPKIILSGIESGTGLTKRINQPCAIEWLWQNISSSAAKLCAEYQKYKRPDQTVIYNNWIHKKPIKKRFWFEGCQKFPWQKSKNFFWIICITISEMIAMDKINLV